MTPSTSLFAEATDPVRRFRDRMLQHPALRALAREAARAVDLDVYLVGGVPRDLLLRREPVDIDLAIRGDPRPFVSRLRAKAGGTLVSLDEDRATQRLVFPGEDGLILDFARFRAETIEGDLRARDLTINAIAIPLLPFFDSAEIQWIDPTGGAGDLREQVIRFTTPQAPIDDPLRSLRAYRFACELSFAVSEDTRSIVGRTADGIRGVAPERISFELLRILAAPRAAWALSDLDSLGVLGRILSEVEEMRGVEQNAFHHLDVLGHSLLTLANMEEIIAEPDAAFPGWGERLAAYLADPDRRAMLKIASLLHDVAKPRCRGLGEDGKLTFYRHAEVGSELVEEALRRLRFAQRQVGLASLWVNHHMRLANHQILYEAGKLADRSLFRTFRKLGQEVVGEILLTLADLRATRGPLHDPRSEKSLLGLGDRMFRLYFDEFAVQRAAPRLVTGNDLLEMGLSAGPEIGRILREIEDAALEGSLKNRDEALGLARRLAAERATLPPTQRFPGEGGGR